MMLAKRGLGSIAPIDGTIEPEPLSVADYEAIKGVLRCYRDILLCKTLRGTGLRLAETLRLTPQHLREEPPDFYFLVKRGKKKLMAGEHVLYEKVYLPPQLGVELRDYIKGNNRAPGESIWGVQKRRVEYIFSDAGRRAVGRPVHPHEFRHLYITFLVDNGLPMESTAKMVGHASHETTRKVYYQLTSERRAEIQRRVPV